MLFARRTQCFARKINNKFIFRRQNARILTISITIQISKLFTPDGADKPESVLTKKQLYAGHCSAPV